MRDEVIYRCVNLSCARGLPRRVNYCPYCGIDQAGADSACAPASARPPLSEGHAAQAHVAPILAKAAGAAMEPGFSAGAGAAAHFSTGASTAAARAAQPAAAAGSAPAPAPGVAGLPPVPPVPSPPPRRRPVQLRWWILALGALWLIWITQRPSTARLDARVDKAVALAASCKANDAQAELIALKKTTATPAQLARLQGALDDADVACRRPPPRAKAPARSSRPAGAAGTATASSSASQSQSQSVRNLLVDARASVARGDYRAAADKMEVCVAMVDANTRECSELKARAERLEADRISGADNR